MSESKGEGRVATNDLAEAAAQAYEDYLVGSVFGPWARRVVDIAAPKPGERVLDVACGTGIGARLAALRVAPGGHIVSQDSDAGMIAVAKKMAAGANLPSDVTLEWHAEPAEKSVVPDGSIDLCLCLQGPQFVNDPPVAIANICRALKVNGRLAASMWNEMYHNKGHFAIAQALESRGVPPAKKPFSKGVPDAARQLIADAGLDIERFETAEYIATFPSVRAFVDGVAAGAPATRHAIAQLSAADCDGFLKDVEDILTPYKTAKGVALPTSSHIVLAYRRNYLS